MAREFCFMIFVVENRLRAKGARENCRNVGNELTLFARKRECNPKTSFWRTEEGRIQMVDSACKSPNANRPTWISDFRMLSPRNDHLFFPCFVRRKNIQFDWFQIRHFNSIFSVRQIADHEPVVAKGHSQFTS